MTFFVRYAGERGNEFQPTSRQRTLSDLKAAMPAKDAWDALTMIERGLTVKTRVGSYYATIEPRPTEKQYETVLAEAVKNGAQLVAVGK